MDLSPLADLMDQLAAWRITEAAAVQDVRDAENDAIAAAMSAYAGHKRPSAM